VTNDKSIDNNELGRSWKKEAVVNSRHYPGIYLKELRININTSVGKTDVQAEI
jgi:hypothetical protein